MFVAHSALDPEACLERVGPAPSSFVVSRARDLDDAVDRFRQEPVDAVLLHMRVPDHDGVSGLIRIRTHAPDVPVVVLTEREDESGALWVLRQGAQDCVTVPLPAGAPLERVIRYAVERNRIRVKLRALSLRDELTGLLNRRGLFEHAHLHLAAGAPRARRFVIFADLDGLKEINDRWGHERGDRAIVEFAGILREVFREPDVIARVGGDEFVALTLESSPGRIDGVLQEVRAAIQARNRASRSEPPISASLGAAAWATEAGKSLEQTVAEADAAMYTHRQTGKPSRPTNWASGLLRGRRMRWISARIG